MQGTVVAILLAYHRSFVIVMDQFWHSYLSSTLLPVLPVGPRLLKMVL